MTKSDKKGEMKKEKRVKKTDRKNKMGGYRNIQRETGEKNEKKRQR